MSELPEKEGQAPPVGTAEQVRVRRRIRDQIPVLSAQVVSVIFAVLVALAVDEWWEERENRQLGKQAMAAVAAEIRSNLAELKEDDAFVHSQVEELAATVTMLAEERQPETINVNYPVALLSSAAWQTAQVTRAVHFVDLNLTVRIARLYDLQNFFQRNQEALADRIAGLGNSDRDNLLPVLRDIHHRYALLAGYRTGVIQSYACVLAELEEPDAPLPETCRDDAPAS